MNGDLRVAYRASAEDERDIVFVLNWFTTCELFPDLPTTQGWVEAMTSLGRLIIFDQPGTGASDPVEAGALPTLEQWADSITAVLDDLESREAVLLAVDGAFSTAALFAATHPSRTRSSSPRMCAAISSRPGSSFPIEHTRVQCPSSGSSDSTPMRLNRPSVIARISSI